MFGIVLVIIVAVDAGVALVAEMSTIKCLDIQICHEHICKITA